MLSFLRRSIFLLGLLTVLYSLRAQEVYSLPELQEWAATHSSTTQKAYLEIQAAQSDLWQARTGYLPQIGAKAMWLNVDKPLRPFDLKLDLSHIPQIPGIDINELANTWLESILPKDWNAITLQNVWLGHVGLVQPLFTGGKIYFSNRMARQALMARQIQLHRTLQESDHEIAKAYYELVQLVAQQKLTQQFAHTLEALISDVETLYDEGMITKGDLLEVRMARHKLREAEHRLEYGLPIAHKQLATLTYLPQGSYPVPRSSLQDLIIQVDSLIHSEAAYAPANTQGPLNIRQQLLRQAEEIARHRQHIAMADMLPKLAFFANYTLANPNPFDKMKREFGGTFSFGFALEVPLSDIATGYFRQSSARTKAMIASLESDEAERKIALELAATQSEFETSVRQYEEMHLLRREAADNKELAELGYKEGVISLERRLRAEQQLFEADSAYIKAVVQTLVKHGAWRLAHY